MPKPTNPDAPPEPEGLADALLAPPRPDPPEDRANTFAPDGSTWATYLGNTLDRWLNGPRDDPGPRAAFRAWADAGRPER